jgi:hypothetical protein
MITGGFGMTMDLERGTARQWVMGRDGIKRWADTNEPVENLPESPTCTNSQTADVMHLTPAIDEKCDHDWEDGADGNPERCSKCGLSFMRYVHCCCP